MRTIARSSSKRKSASARASSVLPTPVGPRNRKRADRPVGVGQAGAAAADGVGHRGDGLVLADDPLVQHVLEADELRHLALHEPGHGHAGPLGDDLGDVLLVDLLLQHLLRRPGARRARSVASSTSRSSSGMRAVADLGGLLEVALALARSASARSCSSCSLSSRMRVDGVLLGLPVGLHRVDLLARGRPAPRRARRGAPARRRRSPWPAPPARSRAGGCAARRRRSRSASSRSRCAAWTRPRRRGRWPCRAGSGR